ncbi:hypothetical protein TIFTF001_019166 [Ficus carica]|uniref:Aminotransferase class V domain-containing protein n=1 Tax=Ficus carica TaxID=3494 RepID=A0AA88ACJ0_FICCA|nr:hypothetical protein TIFTF001_019166 [Ficus carica]
MHAYKEKHHIVIMQMEDESVLYSCHHLKIEEEMEVTYLSVGLDGVVDVEKLKSSIRPDTGLVSNSAANDEICVIQLIEEIGAICKEFENVGIMSLCGDLVYGPKGIMALYPQSQGKVVRIQMQMSGRGEENAIHGGLLPIPLVVGMGTACKLAKQEMDSNEERIMALRQRLLNRILTKLEHVTVHGSSTSCIAGILNVSLVAADGDLVLFQTPQFTLFTSMAGKLRML